MYALCVSGAVNTQCIVWKFLCAVYTFSFIHSAETFSRMCRCTYCCHGPCVSFFFFFFSFSFSIFLFYILSSKF